MKYVSCPYLEAGIHFGYKEIRTCCSAIPGHIFIENYKGEPIDWDYIQSERKKLIDKCKMGEIPECCKGCFELKEAEWEEKKQIDRIYVFHWLHCNCNCMYCVNNFEKLGQYSTKQRKSDYYDLLPIIKDMIKKNLLSNNATVNFIGGEIGVLKEFEELSKTFLKNGVNLITYLTSGIKYSKAVEEAFKKNKGFIVLSLDSGCEKTYAKIKRVGQFKTVINNLKQYIKRAPSAKEKILLKYIIVDKENDNIEEIEKWLQLVSGLNIRNVRLDIEYGSYLYDLKNDVPQNYYDLYQYFKKRTNELNLTSHTYALVDQLLDKGHYKLEH